MPLARSLLLALIFAGAPALAGQAAPTGLKLAFPAACKLGQTCEVQSYFDHDPAEGAVADYRCGGRAIDGDDGFDVRLPDRMTQAGGIAVLAAAAGQVVKARDGLPDFAPATAAPAEPCGNMLLVDHGGGWRTLYCHLAQGSVTAKVGDQVASGQPIGRIGQSGAAPFPHLHFGVTRQGVPVDPFAPDGGKTCAASGALWDGATMRRVTYRPAAVLNAGFTGDPALIESIETTAIPAPVAGDRGVVAYVRSVGLVRGDEQELTVKGPGGHVVAGAYPRPLEHTRTENLLFVGKARQAEAWPSGGYTATYVVRRGGKVVLQRVFKTTL